MNVIIHKQIDSLYKVLPNWKTLKEEFLEVTIFQEKNWLKNWWDYNSKKKKITPYVIEIKERDETVGIIPLYLSIIEWAKFKVRVLKPMGSETSDYLIPILSKRFPPNLLLSLAFKEIYEDKLSWDLIEWKDAPEASPFDIFLKNRQLANSALIRRGRSAVCPMLFLNGDIEEVKSKFSQTFFKGILRKERKLKKEGELEYFKVVSVKEIEPIMANLFELHCNRWGNTDTPSEFRHKEMREHTLRVAKNLYKSNLLHLSYLKHKNEIIAAHYGMSDGKRIYWYIPTMNINFKKYSPTHILIYHLITRGYKEGIEVVDFLRGDEDYKKKWGTIDKSNIKYLIFNRSMKSIALRNFYDIANSSQVKPVAKRFLAKVVKQ